VPDDLWVCRLGRVEYGEALDLQHRLREARRAEEIPDALLLLEHDAVYTRGRRSSPRDLPLANVASDFASGEFAGIPVVDVDRGGKVTYHGPGQLVGYPIMRVEGALAYVRALEGAIVAALADEGIDARSRPGDGLDFTGVWVGDRKVASIGVHVSRGVSTHGFAVNVDADLRPFEWIVPCGLEGVRMTSIALETGGVADMACFRKRMAWRFAQAFGRRQRLVSRARLDRSLVSVA
jgi:lipoyl(octanoyl) transferase